MPVDPGARSLGRYRLLRRLAQGGMGEVWQALDETSDPPRLLVLKRILPHLLSEPDIVRMFASEARLSARLDHPNIVRVIEFGEAEGEHYLAMEHVAGVDLRRTTREGARLSLPPPGFAVYTLREIARALGYAHALVDAEGTPLGIVHRDVTPSNVMLGFDGRVQLLDFGIAKALAETGDGRTQTGNLKGKLGYMSPEQVDGQKADHRADQFAAAIVLHETLTGQRLFRGDTDLETIGLVKRAEVPPPSTLRPEIPAELDAICLRALARDPEARFPDCEAFAAALDAFLRTQPWGATDNAALLETLFPGQDTDPTRVDVARPAERGGTAAFARPAAKGRGSSWILAALAISLLVGGIWTARAMRRTEAPPAVVKPEVHPPARSASVSVEVVSRPAGAEVFLDDEATPRGVTPLVLAIARAEREAQLHLRLVGYEDSTTAVVADRDTRIQVALSAVQVTSPPKTAAHRASAPSKSAHRVKPDGPRTNEDLRSGDVVNPFGRP